MGSNPDFSLAGKVAVITGSGRENGIGAGIALALARAGAKVVVSYLSDATTARADKVVTQIQLASGKESVIKVQVDLTAEDGPATLVQQTLRGFGVDHIDVLVNAAMAGMPQPGLLATSENIAQQFNIGVFAPLKLIQATVPHMPRGGRIINIGSIASKLGLHGSAVYNASKAALDSLTFSMAKELGVERGVTINTIAPGPVETDSLPAHIPQVQAKVKYLVSLTRAEERVGTVEDIADAVLLLVSEKSRWITGQFISVSGGITGG